MSETKSEAVLVDEPSYESMTLKELNMLCEIAEDKLIVLDKRAMEMMGTTGTLQRVFEDNSPNVELAIQRLDALVEQLTQTQELVDGYRLRTRPQQTQHVQALVKKHALYAQ